MDTSRGEKLRVVLRTWAGTDVNNEKARKNLVETQNQYLNSIKSSISANAHTFFDCNILGLEELRAQYSILELREDAKVK